MRPRTHAVPVMSFSDATAAVSEELAGRHDIIVCEGVDKWYGDFQALKGVSANIKEQEEEDAKKLTHPVAS